MFFSKKSGSRVLTIYSGHGHGEERGPGRDTYIEQIGPVDRLLVHIVGQVPPEVRTGDGNVEHSGRGQLHEVGHLHYYDLMVVEELHLGDLNSPLPASGHS